MNRSYIELKDDLRAKIKQKKAEAYYLQTLLDNLPLDASEEFCDALWYYLYGYLPESVQNLNSNSTR